MMTEQGPAIVKRLVDQFRDRNIATVAEGIETRGEASSAQRAGITHFQGFGIAQPTLCNANYSPPAIELSCFSGVTTATPANDGERDEKAVLFKSRT